MIHHGDCLEVMATLPAESVDAIVTDPPYGLEFMGKGWDGRNQSEADRRWIESQGNTLAARRRAAPVYGTSSTTMQRWHHAWAEAAYRVAKPSAYLLTFGGTRTVHRLACAIEDAGWIIRDMLVWGYASGFPKSKASLKPAWEPIVMARKPGPLRMLAIDECRIGVDGGTTRDGPSTHLSPQGAFGTGHAIASVDAGRWPANVILTDSIFDGGWDGVVGGGRASDAGAPTDERGLGGIWHEGNGVPAGPQYGDSGTYSRFFLVPKAARSDREPVLGGLSGLSLGKLDNMGDWPNDAPSKSGGVNRRNLHPTVKPTELMRHLVRLVTPVGGTVLDPFLGSGSTALAAEMEGFDWIGIEREAEYVAIAEARLNGTQRGMAL